MKQTKNIETLLEEFEIINPELTALIRSMRKIILAIAPGCEEKVMYGGIIYAIPGRMFCGLFLRRKHISVEFDLGHLLNDPNGFLEGSGKFRRHLKIHREDEMKTKRVEKFVNESFSLMT